MDFDIEHGILIKNLIHQDKKYTNKTQLKLKTNTELLQNLKMQPGTSCPESWPHIRYEYKLIF